MSERETLPERTCCEATHESFVGLSVHCEREHGHGGAHSATVDDAEIDPDFTYVLSWWPKEPNE